MSVATLDGSLPVAVDARDEVPAPAMTPRTRALLQGPIVATLLRMAWPNVLVMVAQAATGLIETWFVAKLGTDALAGMALVFPGVMLMQMISAGAMGGGISSAIARALGGGRRDQADALVMHALIINIALGVTCSVIMLAFGRPIYRALGGEGAALEAALAYSNVVFAGNVLLWLLNGFASVIRGTGNTFVPAVVTLGGAAVTAIAGVVGATVSAPIAVLASLAGAEWSLRYAFVLFVLATIWAIRLPKQVDSDAGEDRALLLDTGATESPEHFPLRRVVDQRADRVDARDVAAHVGQPAGVARHQFGQTGARYGGQVHRRAARPLVEIRLGHRQPDAAASASQQRMTPLEPLQP